MLAPRDAARLLARGEGLSGLAPLARLFGCTAEPLPLDGAQARALGAPARSRLAVVQGPDERRVLLAVLPRGAEVRETLARLARRLTRESPHLHWAIVAQVRDSPTLVLAACRPDRAGAHVAALTVDRTHLVDSDLETVRLLADASATSGLLAHARWLELLGRDSIGRRFYTVLARTVERLACEASAAPRTTHAERREVALLCVSRLLFLAFLEAKGWLDADHDFLQRHLARVASSGGELDRRLLRPLLFGTLNTRASRRAAAARAFGRVPFLNGGLFTPTPLERRARLTFSDASVGALFGEVLARWRFTAREDQATWSDAAVDPEMLGRAFESLMAAGERRRGGAFYTPHALVRHVTRAALMEALAGDACSREEVGALLDGAAPRDARTREALLVRTDALRVLDPACGSGAFLVHVLETLADLRGRLGDPTPVSERRRRVLVRQLVGVDANPVAAWLCQLRLWLSVVVEDPATDPARILPLPNLDRQVLVGDALDSDAAPPGCRTVGLHPPAALVRLRERYARAVGSRKRTIAGALTRAERARADALLEEAQRQVTARRRDLLAALRSRDLFGGRADGTRQARAALVTLRKLARELRDRRRRLRDGGPLPFAFDVHCADVAAAGGFSLVLGNPPWVRAHEIPTAVRERLRTRYTVLREGGWQAGARAAGISGGFGAQPELAAAFVERALELLAPDGTLALLLPAKLWRTLSGAGVRAHLARRSRVTALEDWSDAPPHFDAVTYPSLLVARRAGPSRIKAAADGEARADDPVRVTVHDARRALSRPTGEAAARWCAPLSRLALDERDPAAPWLLLPPPVRAAFDLLRDRGVPLAEQPGVGRPALGVKTGYNAAFVVRIEPEHSPPDESATRTVGVRGSDRCGRVERELLRPAARGEDVLAWALAADRPWLLWTHDASGLVLPSLPMGAAAWLRPHRARLAARSDARSAQRWWALFRTPAAAMHRPRVVWADIDRRPRAAVLPAGDGTVPLNSCYVSICQTDADALALATLLNGPLAAAWLAALAEPARGGYRRFLGWTLALLPLPAQWPAARLRLAPLAAAALAGSPPSDDVLLGSACEAYGVAEDDVRPLLDWWRRSGGA